MDIIRVGVQAPQGSIGQLVDLDGPRASIGNIANVSSESVAYSLNGGASWTTLAAGASGGSGVIDAGMLRLRKVSSGAYPAPVDVTAELYGLREEGFTASQSAALQALVLNAGISATGPIADSARQNPARALQVLQNTGASISPAFVGGPTPWVRMYGPNELRQAPWSSSAEWTTPSTAVRYTTAQSPANGPSMWRREGASMVVDGAIALANTGAPTFGNYRNTATGLAVGALFNTTLAVLVYCHRPGGSTTMNLRVGTDGSNYVTWRWNAGGMLLKEGWNVLLAHTGEAQGASGVTYGQHDFHSNGSNTEGWIQSAGSFNFQTQAPTFIAFELNGLTARTYVWFEGLYRGGKDRPQLTIGFDISSSGLVAARAAMDKYGFAGYAAMASGNGTPANPQYLWDASTIDRAQSLHQSGWDITQHSVSHTSLGTLSDNALLLAEMNGVEDQLRVAGITSGAKLFPTPNSSFSNRLVALAAETGIQWMRHGVGAPMFISRGLVGLENPLIQGAQSVANTRSVSEANLIASALAYVDLCIMYGVSGHIYTHSIIAGASDATDTNADTFDAILAGIRTRVNAGLIDVEAPSKWLRESAPPSLPAILAAPNRLTLTAGASPFSLINTAYVPLQFVVSGGTVSAIEYSRNGSTFDSLGVTAGQFVVQPGDQIRITYTVAPTIVQLTA